ncbi:MAG TPA: cytoplasmic protein [Candidatus Limnocylindria bacterium]|nr:cytoplasmic protein [Candidatus Limnocylindria bacterium]
MPRVLLFAALLGLTALPAAAQDPVKVDPKHYKVEFENAQVRVLHFHYGPHEKSVMHSHPNLVLVALSDGKTRFALPDGKTQDIEMKANQATWNEATVHNPENMSDKPIDGILIEMKAKAAPPPKKK